MALTETLETKLQRLGQQLSSNQTACSAGECTGNLNNYRKRQVLACCKITTNIISRC